LYFAQIAGVHSSGVKLVTAYSFRGILEKKTEEFYVLHVDKTCYGGFKLII
jgi:hypothetical protein